jgi:hypothetical protein
MKGKEKMKREERKLKHWIKQLGEETAKPAGAAAKERERR